MTLSGDYFYDPEYEGDLKREWVCVACGAGNSPLDGECQWCECGGEGACKRDSCSDPRHFPSWEVQVLRAGTWTNDIARPSGPLSEGPNVFASEDEAREAIEALRALGDEWASAEYRTAKVLHGVRS